MLKLLFLSRRGADPKPLLTALLLWRLHTTAAAVQFTETMLKESGAAADP